MYKNKIISCLVSLILLFVSSVGLGIVTQEELRSQLKMCNQYAAGLTFSLDKREKLLANQGELTVKAEKKARDAIKGIDIKIRTRKFNLFESIIVMRGMVSEALHEKNFPDRSPEEVEWLSAADHRVDELFNLLRSTSRKTDGAKPSLVEQTEKAMAGIESGEEDDIPIEGRSRKYGDDADSRSRSMAVTRKFIDAMQSEYASDPETIKKIMDEVLLLTQNICKSYAESESYVISPADLSLLLTLQNRLLFKVFHCYGGGGEEIVRRFIIMSSICDSAKTGNIEKAFVSLYDCRYYIRTAGDMLNYLVNIGSREDVGAMLRNAKGISEEKYQEQYKLLGIEARKFSHTNTYEDIFRLAATTTLIAEEEIADCIDSIRTDILNFCLTLKAVIEVVSAKVPPGAIGTVVQTITDTDSDEFFDFRPEGKSGGGSRKGHLGSSRGAADADTK